MKLWLLGDPVAQSRSPVMHNAAYVAMGLDWSYAVRRVCKEELGAVLKELSQQGALGANLTIPHKELVLPRLTSATCRVRAIGAANTVRFGAGECAGDNTDGPGWLESWDEEIGEAMAGRPALVIGAGGAARSILWALASRGVTDVVVLNRHVARAAELTARVGVLSEFGQWLRPGGIVVQTTSLGMWPEVGATPVVWPSDIPPGVVACDLIYNPHPSLFLQGAAQLGARTLGGLGMLVHQAAQAIRWWSGRDDVPTGVMRDALEKSLGLR